MQVYGTALSPYVRKVKLALGEKGIDFESIPCNTPEQLDQLHRLNPRGEQPTLVDGELVIADSTIALQYLEEQYPNPALLPAAPAARVKARALEDLGDRLGDAILFALAQVLMRGNTDLQDVVVPAATRELQDLYTYLDQKLGDQEWMCGTFSWAELGLLPTFTGAQFFQLGPEAFPRLSDWLHRCLARPVVQQDMAAVMEAAASGLPSVPLPAGHPHRGDNYRAERAEFFLRNGLADHLRDGIAGGTIRVGLPLMHMQTTG